jgi:hypothetical protein
VVTEFCSIAVNAQLTRCDARSAHRNEVAAMLVFAISALCQVALIAVLALRVFAIA